MGIKQRCSYFTSQLEFLCFLQLFHGLQNHLVLPVPIQKDGYGVDEVQEAVWPHPGRRRYWGLCWLKAISMWVCEPAPDVAVVGLVRPLGEGGRQTPHIEPCMEAPGVLGCTLARVEQPLTHDGLDICAGWSLQGQLVVGLPGEAR